MSESRQSSTEEVAHELFQNIEQFTKQVAVLIIIEMRMKMIQDAESRIQDRDGFVMLMTCSAFGF